VEKIKEKLLSANLWNEVVEKELKALWKYGIDRIESTWTKASVVDFLEEETPLSFFINPASPSKRHHPAWQNKEAGMLRNTTECCLIVDMQLRSFKKFCGVLDEIIPWTRDVVLAATILSDTFKYDKQILDGVEIVSPGKVNPNHGKIAANIWRDKYAKRHGVAREKEIFEATYWHLGRWTPGWTPKIKFSTLTKIVHRIDAIMADNSLELLYTPKDAIE